MPGQREMASNLTFEGEVPDRETPYDAVVFDCDSTLSELEGIDELADERSAEVSELTARAMAGEVPMEAVYGRRLEILRPTRAQLVEIGRAYARTALPHAAELIAALRALGKRVCIVSGGLLPAVLPFGEELGVAREHIHAVDVHFDAQGGYAGYEVRSPLARRGGKPEVLNAVTGDAQAIALVGDGATDLEAAPACARFVAFGGVARRPAVFAAARSHCEVADFAALVPLLFTEAERATLARDSIHAPLLAAAAAFLA